MQKHVVDNVVDIAALLKKIKQRYTVFYLSLCYLIDFLSFVYASICCFPLKMQNCNDNLNECR